MNIFATYNTNFRNWYFLLDFPASSSISYLNHRICSISFLTVDWGILSFLTYIGTLQIKEKKAYPMTHIQAWYTVYSSLKLPESAVFQGIFRLNYLKSLQQVKLDGCYIAKCKSTKVTSLRVEKLLHKELCFDLTREQESRTS